MGRRVQLTLSEVIANPKVEVQLYHTNLVEPEGITTDDQIMVAQVHVKDSEVTGPWCLDVISDKGVIYLEDDFNRWSPSYEFKQQMLDVIGCSYKVF
jgi:hypothetical protein